MIEIDVDREIAPQVGAVGELGGDDIARGLVARVNDQPIGLRLEEWFDNLSSGHAEHSLKELPYVRDLYDRFDLWVIPHSISIIRRSGMEEPVCVGIQVEYKNEGRTCSIRSLIPSPQFLQHGKVQGSINIAGECEIANPENVKFTKELMGLQVGLSTEGSVSLNFAAVVVTPYVSAVGVGSSYCEWRFDKFKEALYGRDIRTWAVIALPKRQRILEYALKYYFEARVAFFKRRYESSWVTIHCKLDAPV